MMTVEMEEWAEKFLPSAHWTPFLLLAEGGKVRPCGVSTYPANLAVSTPYENKYFRWNFVDTCRTPVVW